ncbi:DUF4198 domain-containing protein [Roseococcus sp. SYP-B2431]|uniref:DUF4198 domain-containing protein n=1 Tax=Roseococcus sp. SYP-B2431 TaxID=2496640 RepID=UPI00103F4FFD|nr:DUF4198 domain-containing protein [Roseococcus sp. SYP-B2431]TCI00464.1 DUF4198 domain-containing protein [Roseococcus sp. SYP-B2431]
MKSFPLRRLLLAAMVALPIGTAQAHRSWMMPSATVLSGNDPWVTVDAAVSNDLFYFEHFPMQLDGLAIMAPDGSQVTAENQSRGRYRSTFDFRLTQAGTYRASVAGGGLSASWREGGQQKRWRGTREAFAREVPQNAENLRVTLSQRRVEFFVTRGAPNDRVLQPLNEGLEMVPVTHPNDLVAGEPARFRLLLDGRPAAGVDVEVVPGGNRYRDAVNDQKVKTGEDGVFEIRWAGPGMHWIGASVRDANSGIPGVQRNAGYAATLEVLP